MGSMPPLLSKLSLITTFFVRSRWIFLFILPLSGPILPAYGQPVIDSLETQLLQKTGSDRIPLLIRLIKEEVIRHPEKAIVNGRELLSLLQSYPDEVQVREALFQKGMAHYYAHQPDSILAVADQLNEHITARHQADVALLKGWVAYIQLNFDEAINLAGAAMLMYQSEDEPIRKANGLLLSGEAFLKELATDDALHMLEEAKTIFDQADDRIAHAIVLSRLGEVYQFKRIYDEAITYYTQALEVHEALGVLREVAYTLRKMGNVALQIGDYDEAFAFYDRSRRNYEFINDPFGAGNVTMNLGIVQSLIGNFDEALVYFNEALILFEGVDNRSGFAYYANTLGHIAVAHTSLKAYDQALQFFERALLILEEVGDEWTLAWTLNDYGNLFLEMGRYEEALEQYTRSRQLFEEFGDVQKVAKALNSIANVQFKQGLLDEALISANKALVLADSTRSLITVRDAHQHRATILEQQGQFAEALGAYKLYKAAYDSLFNSESQGVIAELQQQYQTREQARQIELLESRRAQQRLLVVWSISGVVLSMIIIGLLMGRMRLRRRTLAAVEEARRITEEKAVALEKANEHKSRFLANISHEFRTPLTLTFGPLDDIANGRFATIEEAQPFVETARRNGGRLLRLINQLLDLSRFDAGAITLQAKCYDVGQHMRQITALFESLAESQGIQFSVKTPSTPLLLIYDADKLEKVVINLLSNAFKFTASGNKVSVMLDGDEDRVNLVVSDTGQGIAEAHLPNLFDRFYQVDEASTRAHEGAGIGLALVKELVELHQGTINVESSVGFGTRFAIALPAMDTEALQTAPEALPTSTFAELVLNDVKTKVGFAAPDTALSEVDKEETVVLVVEDNPDMRTYIRSHLADQFNVIEAENGKAGVALAVEAIPDLILSDVMMPEMDGLETCAAIKSDERTSHIPVVLLTARAQVEHRIAGFETGADAYLPKPFNAEELQVRIRGLIRQRNRLRERFGGIDRVLRPPIHAASELPVASEAEKDTLVLPAREEAFLKKVEALIDKHLDDTQFGVDEMADALVMSRRQLYRKVVALVNKTPAAMIRQIRLSRAAAMLAEDTLSIKEIQHAIGFQSESSFARAFRQQYDVSPSAYREG